MLTSRLALVFKHVVKPLGLARSVAFDESGYRLLLNIFAGQSLRWQKEVLKWLKRRKQPTRLGVFFAAFQN